MTAHFGDEFPTERLCQKMFRLPIALLATCAVFIGVPAVAQQPAEAPAADELPPLTTNGNVLLATEYRFRGISLSDQDPALQATINLNHESGFYAGIWASNLEGFGAVGGASAEVDLYAGYKREVARDVTVDGGLLYYVYPGADTGDFNYFEPYANISLTRGPFTTKVGLAYAWEQDPLGGNDNLYVFNDNSVAIPGTPITLVSHVGLNTGGSGAAFGSDYLDWSLGASLAWRNLTLGLSYVDTDIGDAQALSVGATRDIVDAAIVATISASF